MRITGHTHNVQFGETIFFLTSLLFDMTWVALGGAK